MKCKNCGKEFEDRTGYYCSPKCYMKSLKEQVTQQTQKTYDDLLREYVALQEQETHLTQIKCADCGCMSSECKISTSSKECTNCALLECCCWAAIHSS